MIDIKKTREELARIHAEATAHVTKYANEDAPAPEAEAKAQEDRFAAMDRLQKQLDNANKLAKYSFESGKPEVVRPTPSEAQKAVEAHEANQPAAYSAEEMSKQVANWAAGRPMDAAYATITTATQSGVFLPKQVAAPLIPTSANTFRDAISIQGMDAVSIVNTPTTAAFSVPVATGAAGGQVAENAGSETENAAGLTESIDLSVKTYQSGSTYYSNQVLATGTVDIVNGVVPVLSYEKELGLESTIVSTMVADSNITQAITLAAATSASLTFAKLQSFNRKLPKRFDNKKVILLSDDAYSTAEALVDSQGRPILAQDTQNQELKRFLGTPVLRCSYLATFGATNVIGILISLLGFRLRDVDGSNLARYDQVPGKPNQVGFNLFAYHGYGYAPSAVALLKCP